MYFCNMIFRHLLNMRSHPTWVRGLKLDLYQFFYNAKTSHPTWVRGLKPSKSETSVSNRRSHPTWVRGLKHSTPLRCCARTRRTLRGCVD